MSERQFVTAEQVVEVHDAIIQSLGGLAGGGHRGSSYEGVDAAVDAVRNSYYDNVYELGAAYAVYIVQGHVFADGNKRTASAVMLEFLIANNARVTLSTTRIVQLTVELQQRAREGEGSSDLVRWLAAEIRPRKKARK